MANSKLKQIQMGNAVFDMVDWYGVCNTSSSTRAKTVSITGFTSNSLFEGTRIVVRFTYAQTYSGTPTLNVNSTGAKNIQSAVSNGASSYEWNAGAIISFIYYNNCWVIEDGGHANTTYYGKTKLSSSIDANNDTMAITPQGVANAISGISETWMWNGENYTGEVLVNITTPAVWNGEDDKYCEVSYSDITNAFNDFKDLPRTIRITFGDFVFYEFIRVYNTDVSIYTLRNLGEDKFIQFMIGSVGARIIVSPEYAGEHIFKIEIFDGSRMGIVTYPMLKEKGYLTLADLPIYDGTVI